MGKELHTDYVHFVLRDGLLIATYKEGLQINLAVAKEIVSKRLQFTEGRSYPVLIYNAGVLSIDKEARDFFSSPDGIAAVQVAAIITDSAYKASLVNFFLRVTRPPIRVKLFQYDTKALAWLRQYILHNDL